VAVEELLIDKLTMPDARKKYKILFMASVGFRITVPHDWVIQCLILLSVH